MQSMDTWDLLLQIVLLLLACFAAGGVMVMFRQSPLVGFLLAGLVLGGPGSFAVVKAESEIEGLAELGVALLLFSLGLEFSLQRVLGLGIRALMIGVLQVVVTMAVCTLIGCALGLSPAGSIACSAMITLSSTATDWRNSAGRGWSCDYAVPAAESAGGASHAYSINRTEPGIDGTAQYHRGAGCDMGGPRCRTFTGPWSIYSRDVPRQFPVCFSDTC